MEQTTKPSQRLVDERAKLNWYVLHDNPQTQTEVIVNHYAKWAGHVLSIHKLIEAQKQGYSQSVQNQIDYATQHIIDSHYNTFGIKLEWKQ